MAKISRIYFSHNGPELWVSNGNGYFYFAGTATPLWFWDF